MTGVTFFFSFLNIFGSSSFLIYLVLRKPNWNAGEYIICIYLSQEFTKLQFLDKMFRLQFICHSGERWPVLQIAVCAVCGWDSANSLHSS